MSRTAEEWDRPPELPTSHYVSSDIYTDPDLFEAEQRLLKRKAWKFACHESELPEIGDYRTLDHSGIPLIVTRSEDGEIRSFVNSCSHRNTKILREPAGNARRWICLFHHWTYNTQGECVAISAPEGYANTGVCKENSGLREVRAATRYGLVFVNLDDDAPSFDDFVGDAFDGIADVLGSQELEVFHYHKAIVEGNWKLWHETNMELYHEYLHYVNRRVAMGGEGYFDRKWQIYPNGHGTLTPMKQKYERVKGWEQRADKPLPGLSPGEFRILLLFPDTTFLIRTTTFRLDTSTPIGPNRTLVEQRGFGIKGEPEEERKMRRRHHNQYWGPFGRNFAEDALAVEALDAAIRGGAGRWGLFARCENDRALDDVMVRAYYEEWGRYMGKPAHLPAHGAHHETGAGAKS